MKDFFTAIGIGLLAILGFFVVILAFVLAIVGAIIGFILEFFIPIAIILLLFWCAFKLGNHV